MLTKVTIFFIESFFCLTAVLPSTSQEYRFALNTCTAHKHEAIKEIKATKHRKRTSKHINTYSAYEVTQIYNYHLAHKFTFKIYTYHSTLIHKPVHLGLYRKIH